MSRVKLTKPQKTLSAIIESEGATITDYRRGANHLAVDFTWDNQQFHTQHMPYGSTQSHRWELNFRSAIRKTKPKKAQP